ncbi:hypothetical protein, partial [Klebsiella pneumoniae]|uniref:hypothetical protein n=1 Tax=Klebsiella pneumoniae TaxID=573 RepID=UPI0013D40904
DLGAMGQRRVEPSDAEGIAVAVGAWHLAHPPAQAVEVFALGQFGSGAGEMVLQGGPAGAARFMIADAAIAPVVGRLASH